MLNICQNPVIKGTDDLLMAFIIAYFPLFNITETHRNMNIMTCVVTNKCSNYRTTVSHTSDQ